MARRPAVPAEEKTRIVLSVLVAEVTVAEAARRAKVSEQSVGTGSGRSSKQGRPASPRGRRVPRPASSNSRRRSRTCPLGEVTTGRTDVRDVPRTKG
jgi:transposase-like protein